MSADDTRALAIVEAALAIEDAAARATYAAQACGDDAALRARVEQLLALDGGDAPFLQTESFARAFGLTDVIAERIGSYRVTGEIARGGMGQVLRAERDDGRFHQDVAIKLIRADIASAGGLARFAEERRMLARLRHPGIGAHSRWRRARGPPVAGDGLHRRPARDRGAGTGASG